jgi:hypothetical protein
MTRRDPVLAEEGSAAKPAGGSKGEGRLPLTPEEVSQWLEEHRDAIAGRWLIELGSRSEPADREVMALLDEFVHLLVSFLAPGMGAHRGQVETLLQQAAELYGNLGAHRRQAAGESVEEFQILRDVVVRFLYEDPPDGGVASLGLRDALRLSRLIDVGVTYTSIGHTDTLFFQLFHGTGVAEGPTPALLSEVREQVSALREELGRLLAHEAANDVGRAN